MNAKWLALSSLMVFIYLIIVNALLFPWVFPDRLVEEFVNARAEGLTQFHMLGLAVTAFLLTVVVNKLIENRNKVSGGTIAGATLGLLVALPEHLHLYAIVDATFAKQFMPVLWTVLSWGVAGLLVGWLHSKGPQVELPAG